MKHNPKLLAAVALALALPAGTFADTTTLTTAQITQIIKDVQTIDPGKAARPASMKETLAGEQAVRTGVDSRTELLFNDHTITRLGANTHFSFVEGTRNMSLESGVMLLQVPKGNGGAKIETAAVTAAVTGTTIMVEAGKNYTKLIVLEGECCLWPKDDKNNNQIFKFKHKSCAHEGQEIILRNGAKEIPDPIYVNLKVLESTSLLITGDWNSPLNTTPINTAAGNQGPGNYVPTNLAIVGAGTDVTITQGQVPPPGGTPPPNSPPGFTPPGKYGPLNTIPGGYGLGGGSTINTDPKITTGGKTVYGRVYRGTIFDGQPVPYLFGAGSTASFPNLTAGDIPPYGVVAFKFGSLNIQGVPSFEAKGNGATTLALVSLGNITMSAPTTSTTLDFSQSPITDLTLATEGGNIQIDSNITVQGLDRFELYSSGASNNIEIDGNVNVNNKFFATTQGNYTQNGSIAAERAAVFAGKDLNLNGNITTYDTLDLEAQGNFEGDNGSISAPYVTLAGGNQMNLDEQQNDGPNTDTVNGVQIDMDALYCLSITGNGINILNGFTGESYNDEQDEYPPTVDLTLTSLDDGDTGSGTITLDGYTYVDEFTATADSDITLNSTGTVESNYDVSMTSNNGSIHIDGQIDADSGEVTLSAGNSVIISGSASTFGNYGTQITATSGSVNIQGSVEDDSYINITAGGDIMTGSESTISASGGEGDGSVSIASTGTAGTVTVDGSVNSGSITISGYDVHTLASDFKRDGIYASDSVTIHATDSVILDGYIETPTLLVNGIDCGPVPAMVTLTAQSEIDADCIKINAGIVDVEGYVTGDEGDFGSTLFSVNTTGGTGPLVNENNSMQDFYSQSGSGSVDAQTIKIKSRGDLILEDTGDETFLVHPSIVSPSIVPSTDTSQTVNGVQINPNNDLSELCLNGATVEVPDGFGYGYVPGFPFTLKLTSNNGDISIGGDIYLGVSNDSSQFDATSAGNIVITNNPEFDADTINLTAGQVTTGGGTLYLEGGSTINVSVSNAAADLEQDDELSNRFHFYQYTTGEDATPVGTLELNFNDSDITLGVSANSLSVGTLDFSSFDSASVSLTSANDINGGEDESASIYQATALALQVGVGATLAGDGSSYISYNNNQLSIDSSRLDSFSVTASSIDIANGFPTLENTSTLSLTATGAGGITVDGAPLNTPNGSITLYAQAGDLSLSNSITASGDITLTGNNINQYEGGSISSTGGSVTLNATTGYVNLQDAVLAGGEGNISITSGSYIHTTSLATLTTGSDGGSLILQANGGNITLDGDLSVSGSFSATASDSVIIGEVDPTIGGDMNLVATNGAIEINNDVTINGNLTLSAGTFIHSADGSTIYGATSVTLTLDAAAEISETKDEGSTLYFGVSSADEEDGYGPIAIDLTNVISGYSSITASATSLTLTSAFNEPNTVLSLNSTDGDLTINGAVTAFNFYPVSNGGDVTINYGVTTGEFSGSSSGAFTLNGPTYASDVYLVANGGNVTVNGQVFASSFDAVASGIATGTGSIFANTVILQQGSSGTVSQPDASHLVFNSLTAVLSSTYTNTEEVELEAGPLTLASSISLPNASLYLFGTVNSQGNTISAYSVTLENLDTTHDNSGNAANLTATATSSMTLEEVSLDGAASTMGSGGTLTASGTGGEGSHTLTLIFDTTANGGSSGGAGGTINLTAQNNINTVDASVSANGGSGGGNGGSITMTSQNGTIASLPINANGGSGSTGAGGNGGTINLSSGQDWDFEGQINANGGDANPASAAAGGNGGTVSLDSDGSLTVDGNIKASSGANGNTKWTGGNGGTVSLTAAGAVTVNSAIEVSSSDLVNNRVSARGGNINVTSHAAAGNSAINISNSGQLAALLNQAAAGPGGQITFLADQGGNIDVSGSLRADAGTIDIRTTGTAAGGQVNINSGAFLSADVIKVGVLSPNGTLTIGAGGNGATRMNGDTLISLYAAGDNGSVVFAGNTFLTGAGLKNIAGSTVTVNNGVNVFVSGGAATVYTNTPNYQGSGGNNSTTGQFTGNGNTTTKPFASRPAF